MELTSKIDRVEPLEPEAHVCWLVSGTDYEDNASRLLEDAGRVNQKPILFGPAGRRRPAGLVTVAVADPADLILDGAPFDSEPLLRSLRDHATRARAEGFKSIRVVADMDWLLRSAPSPEEIAAFEVLIDELTVELKATIVCAYRSGSFDAEAIEAALGVHRTPVGRQAPLFNLIYDEVGGWRLSGEVDRAVASVVEAAVCSVVGAGAAEIDVSGLGFIDVAGMRSLAHAASARGSLRLRGASPSLVRHWAAAGFDGLAPRVELIAG